MAWMHYVSAGPHCVWLDSGVWRQSGSANGSEFLFWCWLHAGICHGHDDAYRIHASEDEQWRGIEQLRSKHLQLRWVCRDGATHSSDRQRLAIYHLRHRLNVKRSGLDHRHEEIWRPLAGDHEQEYRQGHGKLKLMPLVFGYSVIRVRTSSVLFRLSHHAGTSKPDDYDDQCC